MCSPPPPPQNLSVGLIHYWWGESVTYITSCQNLLRLNNIFSFSAFLSSFSPSTHSCRAGLFLQRGWQEGPAGGVPMRPCQRLRCHDRLRQPAVWGGVVSFLVRWGHQSPQEWMVLPVLWQRWALNPFSTRPHQNVVWYNNSWLGFLKILN